MFRHNLQTRIEIDATPEQVWSLLLDFAAYPAWNPFIRAIEGRAESGARLKVRIQPPGRRAMDFRPLVQCVDPGRELRWLGRLLVPGLADGEHRLRVEPGPQGKTVFLHEESFRGVLVPLLRRSLSGDTRRGFEAMNQALKERAETPRVPVGQPE